LFALSCLFFALFCSHFLSLSIKHIEFSGLFVFLANICRFFLYESTLTNTFENCNGHFADTTVCMDLDLYDLSDVRIFN